MLLLLLIVFLIILLVLFTSERNTRSDYRPTLERDGFILLDKPTKREVLDKLPDGYEFLDYKYSIADL